MDVFFTCKKYLFNVISEMTHCNRSYVRDHLWLTEWNGNSICFHFMGVSLTYSEGMLCSPRYIVTIPVILVGSGGSM